MKQIITSESVNIGHPDKTCDYIADSFLDQALSTDPNAQMAVECAIKGNLLMIYGESTTTAKVNYNAIAKQALKQIGYKNNFKIIKKISSQSFDIANAVKQDTIKANDQGMMYGYATNETKHFMPLPIMIAHRLMQVYEEFRKTSNHYYADAKSQVSVVYENNVPTEINTVLVSVSHSALVLHEQIVNDVTNNVINPVLNEYKQFSHKNVKIIVNPSGKFTIWGSFSDSGCVGRKIVVDTYGGVGRVGGGCFSSKNATKVDRSAAYYARYVAKNLVANKFCDRAEIQLSYAIGQEYPTSLYIDCFGTEKVSMQTIYDVVSKNFNFSVGNIITELDLLKPIYKNTACYGHFGREEFSWEKIKKLRVPILKK